MIDSYWMLKLAIKWHYHAKSLQKYADNARFEDQKREMEAVIRTWNRAAKELEKAVRLYNELPAPPVEEEEEEEEENWGCNLPEGMDCPHETEKPVTQEITLIDRQCEKCPYLADNGKS